MANSSTHIDGIISSQASKEVTANAFFDAASPATLYGRRQSQCSGLTWAYYGGNVTRSDNTLAQIGNGTLALTPSGDGNISGGGTSTVTLTKRPTMARPLWVTVKTPWPMSVSKVLRLWRNWLSWDIGLRRF